MKNLLLLAALALSTPALAQRIGIAPITGPGGNAVRNQLVSALCDTADCLTATKVTTKGKPDWKKAKKEALQFFITGAVAKKGKKVTLTLQVLDKPGAPKLSKSFPVERDGLSAATLASAIEALKGALSGGGAVEPPKPPPDVTPPPPPVDTKREPEVRPAEPPREVVVEPAPKVRRRAGDYWLALDVGSDLYNRTYDYLPPQTTSGNLRRYDLMFFPMPRVGLELYPLALGTRDDLLRGLGLEASAAVMPLLKTLRKSDGAVFPTSTMRIDAGVRWRMRFSKDVPFALVPFAGFRMHSFSLGASAADGTRLDGLPNLNYVGARAGLGLEFVAAEELLTIFAQFAVVPVFSSGEVISTTWFPKGSTLGLDGQAGVGIRLLPVLQLRASFIYTRYNLTFRTEPTDTYVANGAFDQYIGGNVGIRLQF